MTHPPIQLDADGELTFDVEVVDTSQPTILKRKVNAIRALPGGGFLLAVMQIAGAVAAMVAGTVGVCMLIWAILVPAYVTWEAHQTGVACDVTMNLDGDGFRNGRLFDANGKRVCTPSNMYTVASKQGPTGRLSVVDSPNDERFAFITGFDWREEIKLGIRTDAVFIADSDGSNLVVIDPQNSSEQNGNVRSLRWVDDETVALRYVGGAEDCHYHIDGTFIGCEE